MACTLSAEQIKSVKPQGFLHNKGTDCFNGRVITVNGKITAAQTKVIAEAAEKFGNGDVEFTTRLTVEVRGIHFDNIPAFQEYIAQAGLATGGTGSLVRPVVSCKGTTCQYGLCDTFALSEKIHERFYLGYRGVKLPHKFKIAVGGCPNNCVKPDLNDLGIIGQRIPNFDEDMCNGCKKCQVANMCPMKACKVEDGVLEIDPEKAVKLEKAGFGEVEHVAIFDEAQRSWTHKRLADYLKRGGTYGNKLKVPNFPLSEAAFLIWSLDQREDWATIVCLVGGGQEINTGEAGISEWIKALNEQFPHWNVYISPKLTEPEYAEGRVNELLQNNPNVIYNDSLHLGVSLRSYRAEKLSAFVHSLLSFDDNAATLYNEIKDKYPIVLTRDMAKARKWLHDKVRGTERTGVLVTKESARFKPLAIHILPAGDENAVHWFLDDKADVRSSNYLEDAATEIQVQGLELDYTCLLWDADMRYEDGKWRFYRFNGQTKWIEQIGNTESKQELMKYMLNAYRVLLTRARAGMVICVPDGNANKTVSGFWEDSTRLPEFYDGTYQYLKSLGIEEI